LTRRVGRTDDPTPHRPRTNDGDRCPRGAQGKPGREPRRQRETVDVTAARCESNIGPNIGQETARSERGRRIQLEGPETARSRAAPG